MNVGSRRARTLGAPAQLTPASRRRHAARSPGSQPGEFELIARHFAPLSAGFPGAFGLLDDAAVIRPSAGCELVVKTDAIVGGVHFFAHDPPGLVARKALRVNLSDLAAKGAVPRAYLLDLMLPPSTAESWVARFARGLAQDQAEFGVHLVGGDTDATPGPPSIAITAFGDVPLGRMLRRSGARSGDAVFVTGTLGDAALGLQALRRALTGLSAEDRAFLVDRFRVPRPHVVLGPHLIGIATAAIDISDGLIADLVHLCEVSGVSARVDASRVPLSPAACAALARNDAHVRRVLTGGDDYEILFTAPINVRRAVAALARAVGVPITEIGRIRAALPTGTAPNVVVVDAHGKHLIFDRQGWTHF